MVISFRSTALQSVGICLVTGIAVYHARQASAMSTQQLPKIMYGTAWKKERTCDLVVEAIKAGFRGIDTACQPKHYYEAGVGAALRKLAEEHGIQREAIFLQTKFTPIRGQDPKNIPYDPQAPLATQVQQSFVKSLENLGTSYLDSLVLHSPLDTHQNTMIVWRQFEGFVKEGKVRQLGISNNYDLRSFQDIYRDAEIKPTILQNRFYPDTGHDKALRSFCKENGVTYQSFWTLTGNPKILSSREVREISQRLSATPEQVLYRFCMAEAIVPLSGTTDALHMRQDVAVESLPFTEADASRLRALLG